MKRLLLLFALMSVSFVSCVKADAESVSTENTESKPIASAEIARMPIDKMDDKPNQQCGVATYYDLGGITANGESFNSKALTAAHPSIPFGSWITVVDQHTGRSVKVRVNDRGPWIEGYILDLTPAGWKAIDPHATADIRNVCIHW
ncbi:MAG: septal ring lytic transglycosylase RlpA family lipoprotein [Cyanobacteria bacterium CRU_2_1]|nr:septal ring lytic transglycosylase RlpA family lipoprotein [Cyanobacteria bacterium RU_5_0]NJR57981.1 septal ring lytic transglycosylase RlpA family lipoprotein [Cyanobacteria bacterium CRU_2_1]